jgi:hypothetical protein
VLWKKEMLDMQISWLFFFLEQSTNLHVLWADVFWKKKGECSHERIACHIIGAEQKSPYGRSHFFSWERGTAVMAVSFLSFWRTAEHTT